MAALTVPSLGGCKVGNTQIRLSSGQLRNHNAIVRINDHKYDIRYAKLYLCNYRNLYGKAYGTDLWESYDADLEQYVKDVTVQELTHIACMDILAENQDMHLSEQEKKQAARAAKEYYQSLTEEEKTFIGLYEREIRTAYEEYALAEKLYHALTQGTDEEISDDEARVVRVQQIYVKEKKHCVRCRKILQREMILPRLRVLTISRGSLSAPLRVEFIHRIWKRLFLISMTERVPM